MTTALPERYRKARNIEEGYEIRATRQDGSAVWYPVLKTLVIYSPLQIVRLTVDTSVDPTHPANDGDTFVVHPNEDVMSRRLPLTRGGGSVTAPATPRLTAADIAFLRAVDRGEVHRVSSNWIDWNGREARARARRLAAFIDLYATPVSRQPDGRFPDYYAAALNDNGRAALEALR